MAKQGPVKGKIVAFDAGRRNVPASVEAKATGSAQPKPFLETWLKHHEDSQSIVRENVALKARQRRLEAERDELIPSLPENVLYYMAILFGLVMAVCWVIAAFVWGKQ